MTAADYWTIKTKRLKVLWSTHLTVVAPVQKQMAALHIHEHWHLHYDTRQEH